MAARQATSSPHGKAFIAEPRRFNLLLRPWNAMIDREMGQRFVPGRLMA
ncbi:hypothetical protein [Agromyces sp. H66]|nr:hypothetical protein [Agromyces sp. H66]